jgi:ABC-type antimicrobial peptide transport system permease subunit
LNRAGSFFTRRASLRVAFVGTIIVIFFSTVAFVFIFVVLIGLLSQKDGDCYPAGRVSGIRAF